MQGGIGNWLIKSLLKIYYVFHVEIDFSSHRETIVKYNTLSINKKSSLRFLFYALYTMHWTHCRHLTKKWQQWEDEEQIYNYCHVLCWTIIILFTNPITMTLVIGNRSTNFIEDSQISKTNKKDSFKPAIMTATPPSPQGNKVTIKTWFYIRNPPTHPQNKSKKHEVTWSNMNLLLSFLKNPNSDILIYIIPSFFMPYFPQKSGIFDKFKAHFFRRKIGIDKSWYIDLNWGNKTKYIGQKRQQNYAQTIPHVS